MRTKILSISAAVLAAGALSAVAQSNVYSLNVVGYVNKVLVGGNKYTAVANPLNTTNNTLAGLFGGAGQGLPATSRVLKWNTAIADFDTFTKTAFGTGWSGPGAGADTTLNPGEGCLILTPAGSSDLTNTFVGEVLQGSLTNTFIPGYQMAGNMVPDSGTAVDIGLEPPTTSRLLQWDSSLGAQGDWVTYTKTAFGTGWSPNPPTIGVAEGFLLLAQPTGFEWVRDFTVAP